MVWLGVKVFPTGTMKAVFKVRDLVKGFGYDRNSDAEMLAIPLNQPTLTRREMSKLLRSSLFCHRT